MSSRKHVTIHHLRTLKISSDHLALIADFHFHGYRLAGTPVVTVCWMNLGDNTQATHRNLSIAAAAGADLILMCEARNRWTGHTAIPAWTNARGWRYYRGDHTVTSYETAVLLSPTMGRYDGYTRLACPRTDDMGAGAGPTHNGKHPDTARYILRTRVYLPRVKLRRRVRGNFLPLHLVPSWTWSPPRRARAQLQVNALNREITGLKLPCVVPGDFNGEARTTLRRLGLHVQHAGRRVATKGRWAPDWFGIKSGTP